MEDFLENWLFLRFFFCFEKKKISKINKKTLGQYEQMIYLGLDQKRHFLFL